jgi:16S rRNA (guanine966-N2)-methyltransferase
VASAGRVIAGRARGIRLVAPGSGTRPLADRAKQTLFAILEPDLAGAAVLDLCAGSGAAGIEALSRGAARAVLVERDAGACQAIEENLRRTGLAGPTARVARAEALAYLGGAAAADGPFDVVVLDPPYAEGGLRDRILAALAAPDAPLSPGARVVATHAWRDAPPEAIGLLRFERARRFGETALAFYRRVDAGPPAEAG